MSIDRSLKTSGGLTRHRNVLTRAERVAKLSERNRFNMTSDSPLALVKVGNRKLAAGGKSSKKEKAAETAAGAAAPAAAPAAKGGKK